MKQIYHKTLHDLTVESKTSKNAKNFTDLMGEADELSNKEDEQ